ncbi:hypothetical protein CO2235_MP10429 [Cupriavidus oxalaticus]|uniref:Uncharacterized protein n=1 Tax=Cupriavidus oxalaticus TaxID=96344 RepID=A0A375GHY6_9BURK|nr:hypothetical protein CO2235_MP10429 [Cupriavidus oxalaticus]
MEVAFAIGVFRIRDNADITTVIPAQAGIQRL